MGWFIVIIIVGGIIALIISAVNQGNILAQARDSFMASHEGWEVYVSSHDQHLIAIDQTSKRLALGTASDYAEYAWSDLCSVEIERNGDTITATNRGSQAMGAAVGALLLGPAGLLLGGLTGRKRSFEKVKSLSLKVTMDEQTQPVKRIFFFKNDQGLKPDSAMLKPFAEAVDKFHALLANAIRLQARLLERPVESGNSEDRIAKLWQLKESGALSQDEFAAAKSAILGGQPTAISTAGQ